VRSASEPDLDTDTDDPTKVPSPAHRGGRPIRAGGDRGRMMSGRRAKAAAGGFIGGWVPYGFQLVNGEVCLTTTIRRSCSSCANCMPRAGASERSPTSWSGAPSRPGRAGAGTRPPSTDCSRCRPSRQPDRDRVGGERWARGRWQISREVIDPEGLHVTAAARVVLSDCDEAIAELSHDLQGSRWRRRWATVMALLRAVAHVLRNVAGGAGATSEMRATIASEWAKGSRRPDPDSTISWRFIEIVADRNILRKEYRFVARQGINVPAPPLAVGAAFAGRRVLVPGPLLSGRGETMYARNTAPFAGHDPRRSDAKPGHGSGATSTASTPSHREQRQQDRKVAPSDVRDVASHPSRTLVAAVAPCPRSDRPCALHRSGPRARRSARPRRSPWRAHRVPAPSPRRGMGKDTCRSDIPRLL
jgi:hypothetical protein